MLNRITGSSSTNKILLRDNGALAQVKSHSTTHPARNADVRGGRFASSNPGQAGLFLCDAQRRVKRRM
jgi:hypothetical protein